MNRDSNNDITNSENDNNAVDEDRLWKKLAEESLLKQQYQSDLEINELRKKLLLLKTQIASIQFEKEQFLQAAASLDVKIKDITYHKVVLEYHISKNTYQKSQEDTETNDNLMDIAVQRINKSASPTATKKSNLTNYSLSDSE